MAQFQPMGFLGAIEDWKIHSVDILSKEETACNTACGRKRIFGIDNAAEYSVSAEVENRGFGRSLPESFRRPTTTETPYATDKQKNRPPTGMLLYLALVVLGLKAAAASVT
jgi:hypothetical protein